MHMGFGGNTETGMSAIWREHCAPLIEKGQAFVYGSPEHLEYEQLKREIEAEEKAGERVDG